jgi:hypothetical protein
VHHQTTYVDGPSQAEARYPHSSAEPTETGGASAGGGAGDYEPKKWAMVSSSAAQQHVIAAAAAVVELDGAGAGGWGGVEHTHGLQLPSRFP